MEFQRARTEMQKQLRIDEILNATASLYEKYPYEKITFSLIAKEYNLTRSNIYKYFQKKEDIFLELLSQDIIDWGDTLEKELQPLIAETDNEKKLDSFAKICSKVILNYERMLKLFSIQFTLLVENATFENILKYKSTLIETSHKLVENIHVIFPQYTLDECENFYYMQYAFICGLYPLTHLSAKHQKALETVGDKYLLNDFSSCLEQAIKQFLK